MKSEQPMLATHISNVADDMTSSENEGGHERDRHQGRLVPSLQSRHMQMIAIGGSIGAGLFVGSGSGLQSGGPASLLIGFAIIGVMILCTLEALCELSVMFPVNGAFTVHVLRFLDPALGFAVGWQYAVAWLVTLPFELTAAGITIDFWHHYHTSIWVAVFLFLTAVVQIFGVKGYGEVEFVLSIIKITAIIGFILFGIIVNCGGVPTDDRGYIGFRYWSGSDGNYAFRHGFKGLCTVFVNAAFAFAGTELVGLAAAESADPIKAIPKATKQVVWRILFFFIVSLLIVGIIVPNNSPDLLNSSGANTKASPFVLAIQYAGVKGLPSVMNAAITISVLSVANSSTFATTRTLQALASQGMAPAKLAYIDAKGRPVPAIILQLLFGLLAFINEASVGPAVFNWLLALSGLSSFFVWGAICLSHIRFRRAWKLANHTLEELPFRSRLGVYGSYVGFIIVVICFIATFYTSLFPIGGSPNAQVFFQNFLAAPVFVALLLFWKVWTRDFSFGFGVKLRDMDLDTGRRHYIGAGHTGGEEIKPRLSLARRLVGAFL